MDTVQITSSSEDDDDMYLNSVAKLKELKKQTSSHLNKEVAEKSEEKKTEGIEVPKVDVVQKRPGRKTRAKTNNSGTRTRQQGDERVSPEQDSDLEIVSVEEKTQSVEEIPNSASKDDLIVEQLVDLSEDENYDIDFKILWRSKNMHRLNIRQNENFRKIFEYFANLEDVSIDEILITKKDKTIKKNDTPTSINLSVIDILEGGIVKKDSTMLQKNTEGKVDENVCMIKVQTTNKKSLTIPVKRDDNFKNLWAKCAEELNTEETKMKLYFDGEVIAITNTPDSLDIEDEACFDLRLSS
ncbi:PREDICTED: uncharacterized protein CG4449 [Dufourea novaeangliae]|uniref:uncharacterized protein CG4449 n=1 Tax=Dufourea novaeangliae TaxID=178035 RepID=UPI0007672BCC|nr:PREDICTED: uncharacterized protein CG4449 [Dufourea novaeangliae]